ncbi:MAG: glycosyltransferase, partial [Bacteroidetes bacterium]|nr:glycosyltransferase [Bacteroidota bacterium]
MATNFPTLNLSIVIPSHHETNLSRTLEDLNRAAQYSGASFRVYVILNESERASHKLKKFHANQKKQWSSASFRYELTVLHCTSIRHKKAGVGYARKYGLEKAIQDRGLSPDHILIWLDADCELRPDYISGWTKVFQNLDIDAAVMQFEHRTDAESSTQNQAILEYEAHLRYYHHLQQQSTYPHAMQPIGSCIGVRSSFYEKIGGMRPRKAGEDFYFLQKCMLNGRVVHAKNTRIFPSNRRSTRVPFGTGRAMIERENGQPQMTYDYSCMPILYQLISTLR